MKITIVIDHSPLPQTITLESGEEGVLTDTLEFLEIALRCMTYNIDGKKLELIGVDE